MQWVSTCQVNPEIEMTYQYPYSMIIRRWLLFFYLVFMEVSDDGRIVLNHLATSNVASLRSITRVPANM
jgi:hypothetical protein